MEDDDENDSDDEFDADAARHRFPPSSASASDDGEEDEDEDGTSFLDLRHDRYATDGTSLTTFHETHGDTSAAQARAGRAGETSRDGRGNLGVREDGTYPPMFAAAIRERARSCATSPGCAACRVSPDPSDDRALENRRTKSSEANRARISFRSIRSTDSTYAHMGKRSHPVSHP